MGLGSPDQAVLSGRNPGCAVYVPQHPERRLSPPHLVQDAPPQPYPILALRPLELRLPFRGRVEGAQAEDGHPALWLLLWHSSD